MIYVVLNNNNTTVSFGGFFECHVLIKKLEE